MFIKIKKFKIEGSRNPSRAHYIIPPSQRPLNTLYFSSFFWISEKLSSSSSKNKFWVFFLFFLERENGGYWDVCFPGWDQPVVEFDHQYFLQQQGDLSPWAYQQCLWCMFFFLSLSLAFVQKVSCFYWLYDNMPLCLIFDS